MNKNDKEAVYVRQGATPVLITSNAQTTGVSQWKANSKPTFSRIGKRSLEGTEIPPALAGWFFISLDSQTRCAAKWMTVKEYGRSMVEMLGVLAIIGLLSIGVLKGYSAAITKHKINETIIAYETIISGLWPYKNELQSLSDTSTKADLIPYISDLNLLPEKWYIDTNPTPPTTSGTALIDPLNNQYSPFIRFSHIVMDHHITSSNIWFCVELILNFAKPNAEAFSSIRSWPNNQYFYGKHNCNEEKKCISSITATEAYQMCTACVQSDVCYISFDFLSY
ncbi:MAG: type II secretion system protein [Alphaproteobacteria bacterium]|nr:type II secretion system protein [Alphaproteobacteria bacterium]